MILQQRGRWGCNSSKKLVTKDNTMTEKARREKLKHATANALLDKGVSIEDIAKI